MFKYYKKCNVQNCDKCEKANNEGGCTDYMFIQNQYEEYNRGIFCYGEHVKARYIEQNENSYKGNPLIEALPPALTEQEILNKIERFPRYSKSEKNMDYDYRINAIIRLKKDFFYIFSKHIEIYVKLYTVIKAGYEGRNILTPCFIQKVNFTSNLLSNKWVKDKQKELSCIASNSDTAMDGWSMIGMSGEGKTEAINQLLTTFPQVIVHTEYGGRKFLFYQLVWLKIDCSYTASVKQICIKFFQAVDDVIGTEYLRKFGSKTNSVDNMIVAIAHITQIHAIGALIIDEIQHLTNSRNGIESVLNFLVTLKNEMKVPIIYIGTFKTTNSVLGKNYTQARRASGIGEIVWSNMDKDDEWDNFINEMWKFQWTKKEQPLTSELSKVFYDNTMGITDRAIKLFMAVQFKAILTEQEQITIKLINEVAKKNMPLTNDMIKALRDKDIKKLGEYEDIKSFDIQEYINEELNKKEYQEKIKQEKQSELYKINRKKQELESELVLLMIKKGIVEKLAEKVAKLVIKEHGINENMEFMEKEAGKMISEIKKNKKISNEETKNNNITKNKKDTNKNSKLGYAAYKEDGLIKPVEGV